MSQQRISEGFRYFQNARDMLNDGTTADKISRFCNSTRKS